MSIRIPPIFYLYNIYMNFKKKGGENMCQSELSYLLHNMMIRSHTDYEDLAYEAAVHATNAEYSKSMGAQVPTRNLIQRL